MLSSTLSAQFLNYPETLGNLDDFGRVSTTKQISELRHITEKERQARRENTGILEMNQSTDLLKGIMQVNKIKIQAVT